MKVKNTKITLDLHHFTDALVALSNYTYNSLTHACSEVGLNKNTVVSQTRNQVDIDKFITIAKTIEPNVKIKLKLSYNDAGKGGKTVDFSLSLQIRDEVIYTLNEKRNK